MGGRAFRHVLQYPNETSALAWCGFRSIYYYLFVLRIPIAHYGLSFPAFTRSGVRIAVYAETCVYARGYVYAPALYTYYRSRKRI